MLPLLITIAGIHFVALVTPGPDFFFVSQVAASQSRKDAFKAVLGIASGVFVWAGIALLGLHVLLQKVAWLQKGIMIAGGLYLSYLAFLLLRSAYKQHRRESRPAASISHLDPVTQTGTPPKKHLFLKGLLTNLSNPKAVIYFGSVFSAFVGTGVSNEAKLWIFALIVIETIIWFLLVATIFALPAIQKGYRRSAKWIDGCAGVLFAGFSLSLIYRSFKP